MLKWNRSVHQDCDRVLTISLIPAWFVIQVRESVGGKVLSCVCDTNDDVICAGLIGTTSLATADLHDGKNMKQYVQ